MAVTLRDIAQTAKVHASTVSLALRNDPRLPEDTRKRIQKIARRLGYRPNPLIAALNVARRRGQVHRYQANLAFVGFYADSRRLETDAFQREIFQGACRKAASQGYGLEHLWFRQPGMTPERFQEILKHRRIHGLILSPLDNPSEDYELEWQQFVCVAVGLSLNRPCLQRVVHDNYRAMQMVLRALQLRGTRRVGLCLEQSSDERTLGMWTGAYLHHRLHHRSFCLPPLLLPRFHGETFNHWVRKHRPETIISVHPMTEDLARHFSQSRLSPLKNEHIVSLNLASRQEARAGIYQNPARLGELAVERLVDLLNRHQAAETLGEDELLHLGEWVSPSQ
jgi:LacI family transcriptional regulator